MLRWSVGEWGSGAASLLRMGHGGTGCERFINQRGGFKNLVSADEASQRICILAHGLASNGKIMLDQLGDSVQSLN